MKVLPINQNSTVYKGYPDKSVYSCADTLERAASKVKADESCRHIMFRLESFMSKLHKKTILLHGNGDYSWRIENPLTKGFLAFSPYKDSSVGKIVSYDYNPGFIHVSNHDPVDLRSLIGFVEDIEMTDPEEINKFFYKSAISEFNEDAKNADNFLKKIILMFKLHKIKKYARQTCIDMSVNDRYTKILEAK